MIKSLQANDKIYWLTFILLNSCVLECNKPKIKHNALMICIMQTILNKSHNISKSTAISYGFILYTLRRSPLNMYTIMLVKQSFIQINLPCFWPARNRSTILQTCTVITFSSSTQNGIKAKSKLDFCNSMA